MKKYKILVITDHSRHSDQNSIYALLTEMLEHEQCEHIDVISRGNSENKDFFLDYSSNKIYGTRINKDFGFSLDGQAFTRHLNKIDLGTYDLVFMRLPRPIQDDWLIGLNKRMSNAIFVNKPRGIIKTSSKRYLLNFPEQCPYMYLCNSAEDVLQFSQKFPIVLKPLKEYGGKGIVKIDGNQVDVGNKRVDLVSYLKSIEKELNSEGYLAMKYLKNVKNGDKRILVVGGEIIASSLRLPAEGSWLCNIAQGGKSIEAKITVEEEKLIETITPSLLDEGILIYGADTIEDDDGKRILSEVNTLSIGGFPQAQKLSGKPIIKLTINKIFKYANEQ